MASLKYIFNFLEKALDPDHLFNDLLTSIQKTFGLDIWGQPVLNFNRFGGAYALWDISFRDVELSLSEGSRLVEIVWNIREGEFSEIKECVISNYYVHPDGTIDQVEFDDDLTVEEVEGIEEKMRQRGVSYVNSHEDIRIVESDVQTPPDNFKLR